MAVYMIRAGENGPVKIGRSQYPYSRVRSLQVSHWETLKIIRIFAGEEDEESKLHSMFSDQHIRGEWHHFSLAMLGDVGLADMPIVDQPRPHTFVSPSPIEAALLAQIIRVCGGSSAMGRALGIASQGVSQWRRVPIEHVRTVMALTGMQKHEIRPDVYDPADRAA